MNQYIQYHKQPYSKFHSIREFNAKFGTDIPENEEYEMMFHYVFDNAKKMQGPDEFLQVKFYTQEEFENMADEEKKSIWDRIKGGAKGLINKAKDLGKKAREAIKNIGNKKDTEKKLYDAIEMACDLDSDRDMIKAKIDDILEEYDENAEFTAFDVLNDAQEHFEEMGLGIGASMKLLKFAAKYPLLQIKIMKIISKAGKGDMAGAAKEVLALVEKEAKNLNIDMKEIKKKFKTQFLPLMEKAAKAANVKIPKEIIDALTKVQPSTMNDLDDLLSGDEEEVEEEYDEELDVEPAVTNIVTEKKKISDLVRKTSSDSAAFSKDMRHLIQFKNSSLPLNEQLMKGRPKYLKAIKSFVKGDKNAEVKMSWREGTKTVKIADLKPKIESLKALLRTGPGELRVVQCL